MKHRLITLDPGGTTGWVRMEWMDEDGKLDMASGALGPEEHHDDLWCYLDGWYRSDISLEIVSESFEFRKNSPQYQMKIELISKEYIGVTKLFCAQRDLTYVEYQAGVHKPFTSDEVLKKLGLYKGITRHERDAYRVAFYHLQRTGRLPRSILEKGWK